MENTNQLDIIENEDKNTSKRNIVRRPSKNSNKSKNKNDNLHNFLRTDSYKEVSVFLDDGGEQIFENDYPDKIKANKSENKFKRITTNKNDNYHKKSSLSSWNAPKRRHKHINSTLNYETDGQSKKLFYKQIKAKNVQNSKKIMNKRRLEFIFKLIFYIISNVMNILSVINYIVQTFFEKKTDDISRQIINVTEYLEIVFSYYFLCELFLFLYLKRGFILKYLWSFDFVIDFVTIFPPIIWSFLNNKFISFQFIRILRIFRVFRVLRVYKTLKNLQIENATMTAEDQIGPKLNPIKLQFYTILVILFCNFFICAGIILGLNDLIENAFNEPDMNFFDAFYYIIVFSSTLGYGDIVPTHPVTRLLIILSLFSLVVIVSNQVSKLSLILRTWGPASQMYKCKEHFILVLDSSINYIYVLLSLQNKYEHKDIIIISKEDLILTSPLLNTNKIKLINVIDYDLEAFDRANIKNALALLIFTEKVTYFFDQKEKIIDFLLLKLHRFYSNTPIYLQTLFSDRSSFTTTKNNKTIKFKKIIPIMKIKSLIESKSIFNPGFACFIQNLIFNDTAIPEDYETYNPLMKNYLFGTENKIVIKQFPEYFFNMQFSEAVFIVYLKSIAEHFVKLQTNDKKTNRGILLIGIMEKNKFNIYDKEEVKIFPEKYIIKAKSQGVFISYDENFYVDNFLASFKHIIEEVSVSKFSSEKLDRKKKTNETLNLGLIFSDDPNRITKKDFYRRSALIDTINNSIFKVSNGFANERPFSNLNQREIIQENEEENLNKSSSDDRNKNLHYKRKNSEKYLKKYNSIKHAKRNSLNKDVDRSFMQNSKENESFKVIQEEFCLDKLKKNSSILSKASDKFENGLDHKEKKKGYNNFIDNFLNKYDIKSNEAVDEMVELNKGRSKSSLENDSLIEKESKKKNKENSYARNILKSFDEADDFIINANITEKNNKNKEKKYSRTNHIKRIDSVCSKNYSKDFDQLNNSDVLILNNNKKSFVDNINNNNINKKHYENEYDKLKFNNEEQLKFKNKYDVSLTYCNESEDSLGDSTYKDNSNKSSFISKRNNVVKNKIDLDQYPSNIQNKKDFLNLNSKVKIEKLFQLDENNLKEENRNSTKEKQNSTKIISENDPEMGRIDNSSYNREKNKKVFDKNDNLNKTSELDYNIVDKQLPNEILNDKFDHKFKSSNNYLKKIFCNFQKNNIPHRNSYTKSSNNITDLKGKQKIRRSSLAIEANSFKNLGKKNFKEDSEIMQEIPKLAHGKSSRRLSLDENSIFKNNLSKLNRASIFYSNNNILKNLILKKEDVRSIQSPRSISDNSSNINVTEQNMTGFKNKFFNKMQVLNSSSSVFLENSEDDENKIKKTKKGILYDKSKFKAKNTRKNLDFLNKFEHIYDKKIMEEIKKKNDEHYSELKNLVYRSLDNDYIFEHRIFEIDRIKAQDIFSNHILIIGYQDALDKFVKLITYHFPNKSICFLGTEDHKFVISSKLLKQYKNVYFFQGDPTNPFHLLNSGFNNAHHVIILSENIFKKLNEDMTALLSSRLTDYYFDINMLIELWDSKNAKLLGYNPLDKKANNITNEFYHPMFMAGRLIYLSHLDKLTTLSVTDPNVIETLYQIISVGFRKFVNNLAKRRTNINMRLTGDVPIVNTIDLPEHYWGKEYYVLVQDLLTLEKPAIPLGIYITDPLSYHLLDSQGKISQSEKNNFWKIINSHKRRLINMESMGRFESAYFDNMKFLRDISYTDKIVLNYVDLQKAHLPIFITNPLPGFILSKDCKVLIMTNYAPSFNGISDNQNENRKDFNLKSTRNLNKTQPQEIPIDDKIRQCQENYLKLLHNLNKKFSTNYIEALKNAEKMKKDQSFNKKK